MLWSYLSFKCGDGIVGYDPRDHRASNNAAQFIPKDGYKQFLKSDGLHGKRVGIVRDPDFSKRPGSSEAVSFEKHLGTLRQEGATLVENHDINAILSTKFNKYEFIVMLYEFKHNLNIHLSELLHSPVHTLADIISFNERHAQEENISKYGQDVFLKAQSTSDLNAVAYKEALEKIHSVKESGIDKVLKAYKLDALVTPTNTITSILAIAGYPGITVPAGYNEFGVPFGICFGGGRGSEPILIEIAYAFEQATKIREIHMYQIENKIVSI